MIEQIIKVIHVYGVKTPVDDEVMKLLPYCMRCKEPLQELELTDILV